MRVDDGDVPRWLLVALFFALILALLFAMALLGYLPSPLSNALEAHDRRGAQADRAGLITCGALMEMTGRRPIRCFDQDDPKNVFVGTQ